MSNIADELELVQRTAKGDAAAFRKLAEFHLNKIMNFAYRMLCSRADAEDVAQETFLRLWKEANRYKPTARLITWLHRIAHNLCVDRLRARREQPSVELDDRQDLAEPSALLDQKQMVHEVSRALNSLPERQRAAMALVHYQELTNIEAAEVLDVSIEALESLLARARRTLRELLAELNAEGDQT